MPTRRRATLFSQIFSPVTMTIAANTSKNGFAERPQSTKRSACSDIAATAALFVRRARA
jgi:hypothetical protein